ncbi:type IV pilus modification PilV family protein [Kyrpidia tusciae]|uniref:type IV pilus modification PilV family protein n=1 Tax=Kyrpidia tusciae TaxID=33943 RepID=UPI0011D057AD|nr:prepilin-type N-terminal cleavage/methylation domain-containing protein [Kyrpidia tusciae]
MRRTEGFTLVEALASLTIAAALLVGIMGYFTTAYVGIRQDGTRTRAVSQTEQAMEATRAWLMDQYAQGGRPGSGQVQPSDLASHGFNGSPGINTVVTYTYPQSGPPGWEITVTTTWQSRGQLQTYEVKSFFGEYDHAKSRAAQ